MRLALSVLSIFSIGGSALAQEVIEIWPGVTNFTSRGNIGVGDGETLQGFHASYWVGIGNTGPTCALQGLSALSQDQDVATPELFDWVIRDGDDSFGPYLNNPNKPEFLRVVGMSTPPSTGTGPGAFRISTSLLTPASVPCDAFYAVGLGLPVAPLWPQDGQSTHVSYGFQGGPATNAQISGAHQEEHGWQVIGTGAAATASHPSSGRSWRYQLLVDTPVMQLGNEDAAATALKLGMGGMFPDTPLGTQQWGAGFSYAAGAGDTGTMLLALAQGPGLPVLPGTMLWLDFNFILVGGSVTLDVNGQGDAVTLNPIPPTVTGKIFVQGVVLGASGVHLTNGQHVSFN